MTGTNNINKSKDRKTEILETASRLFLEKGFDGTSIADILKEVGIAKGTLYHHFKSKEEIMDELISIKTNNIIIEVKSVSEDESLTIEEKMVNAIAAMNVSDKEDSKAMMEHMNKPQNALMNQKINKILLNNIPPILAKIIEEGVKEEIFNTPYPLEAMEISIIYLDSIFDVDLFNLSKEELIKKTEAFFYFLEKILGVKERELDYMKNLFMERLNA